MFNKKDQHKKVVEGHIDNNMHIAKMVSDSPLQMIRLNQVICGLGIMFVVTGKPSVDVLKIVLMISTFVVGFFISRYVEQGIVFGSTFFRKEKTKTNILSGLSIVAPMFLISVFFSDVFFYSVVQMTGKANILAEAASIIVGIALPTLQMLQQIHKKNVEDLVKESTSATEMNTHMYLKKRENLLAAEQLASVKRVVEDPESIKLIDQQVRQGMLREIAKLGTVDQLDVEENIIDSTIEEVVEEKVEDVEQVEAVEEHNVKVVDNVVDFPRQQKEGIDIDEVLSTLSVEQLRVLILPQHRLKRIEIAQQCQITDATVARKIKKLINTLSAENEA